MITDEALLRPYLSKTPLPCPVTEIIGVSTYIVGIGEGIFYGLKDGRLIDDQGDVVGKHGFREV